MRQQRRRRGSAAEAALSHDRLQRPRNQRATQSGAVPQVCMTEPCGAGGTAAGLHETWNTHSGTLTLEAARLTEVTGVGSQVWGHRCELTGPWNSGTGSPTEPKRGNRVAQESDHCTLGMPLAALASFGVCPIHLPSAQLEKGRDEQRARQRQSVYREREMAVRQGADALHSLSVSLPAWGARCHCRALFPCSLSGRRLLLPAGGLLGDRLSVLPEAVLEPAAERTQVAHAARAVGAPPQRLLAPVV